MSRTRWTGPFLAQISQNSSFCPLYVVVVVVVLSRANAYGAERGSAHPAVDEAAAAAHAAADGQLARDTMRPLTTSRASLLGFLSHQAQSVALRLPCGLVAAGRPRAPAMWTAACWLELPRPWRRAGHARAPSALQARQGAKRATDRRDAKEGLRPMPARAHFLATHYQ